MEHYVCPECGGTSEQAKNCETVGCSLQARPLLKCQCEDGQHVEVQQDKQA